MEFVPVSLELNVANESLGATGALASIIRLLFHQMNYTDYLKSRETDSPINGLFKNFSASPFKIVPEREKELERIRDTLKLRINLEVGGSGFLFKVGFENGNKLLRTNLITLEKIWALSYGYFTIQYLQEQQGGGVVLKIPESVRVLLGWVHATPFEVDVVWPENTPRPDRMNSGDFIAEANEVFLCVCSFVLLHEVGHHIRGEVYYQEGDGSDVYNHQIEANADSWAWKFILDRWFSHKDDSRVMMKRAYAVGVALVILASLRMIKGWKLGTDTHPSALHRLRAFFGYLDKDHAPSATDEVGAVKQSLVRLAFAVLKVTIDIHGGDEPQIKHVDSDSCLNYIETRYAELYAAKKGAEAPDLSPRSEA